MSDIFKTSGKRSVIPQAEAGWKFTRRPGGWVIAESPDGWRIRMSMAEVRGKLSCHFVTEGVAGRGISFHGEIIQEQMGGAAAGGGDSDLVAQFPGKVRKVLVEAGKKVKEGEPLLLVEAMKMEFAVKSPFNARVKKVLVKEGQQLSPGDRFVDLEPLGEAPL